MTGSGPSFPDAFTVGLDIFQNIDVLTINWNDAQVAEYRHRAHHGPEQQRLASGARGRHAGRRQCQGRRDDPGERQRSDEDPFDRVRALPFQGSICPLCLVGE